MTEVSFDEGIEVTIENCLGVTGFDTGAKVFDKVVGMEDVAADLRAPFDFLFAGVFEGGLFFAFFEFELVELGAQHFHGGGAVFNLGAFVLASDDDAGGDVGDADSRIGDVDMLAALAA